MATSGYSEDLQSQQANAVTIATPAATAPSSAKAAHFLSEIPPASTSIAASNPSAVSKAGQDALCSPTAGNQNQKPVALTTATQHYVSSDIQQSAAQKSNGQSSSPQYIIVTVTGERSVSDPRFYTHAHATESVCLRSFWLFSVSASVNLGSALSDCIKTRPFTIIKCITGGNGNNTGVCMFIFGPSICRSFCLLVSSHTALSPRASCSGTQADILDLLTEQWFDYLKHDYTLKEPVTLTLFYTDILK